MAMPKIRFYNEAIPKVMVVKDLFYKQKTKNKDGLRLEVLTNSAENGIVSQKEFFDKDIAIEGNTSGYYVVQKYDFIYNPRKSTLAPYGPFNCCLKFEKGIVSPLYTCLTPKNKDSVDYLSWYFKSSSWHKYVSINGCQGARDDRVSMTDSLIMKMPVYCPCLEEQKKISNFLSTVDSKFKEEQKKLDDLEQIKKGFMQKIFSQQIRFKADDGSEYPEWKNILLSDCCDMLRGQGLNKNDIKINGLYKAILYGHLYTEYGMICNKVKYYTDDMPSNKVLSKCNDILIPGSDTTPTGLARACCLLEENVILGGDINVLRPKKSILSNPICSKYSGVYPAI